MEKTSQKITKDKDSKCADAGCKDMENLTKKMKENILNDAKKVAEILPFKQLNYQLY